MLLNLGLADSQGLDTLRSVTKSAPRVPVIVFTGRDDDVMGRVAVREGAQDYLYKGRMIDGALMRTEPRYSKGHHPANPRRRDTRQWTYRPVCAGVRAPSAEV